MEKAKFRDLKEEALESGHCSLTQFDAMVFKAEELMKCKKVKALKAEDMRGHARHYGIEDGAVITARHIQSVLLYTDFSKLCSIFSGTFRAAHLGESVESIKSRNSSWFEMSKLLRETVECFGNRKHQETGPFYCGVNRLMLVSSFGIRLCSPTSTSKSLAVAIRFADTQGIVMRYNNESANLRFFDCSYVSAFTEESERLFFGGDYRTRVESVLVIDGFKNYRNYFRMFYTFDLLVSGGYQRFLKKEITTKDEERLKWFIDRAVDDENVLSADDDSVHDKYIVDTFDAYIRNKKDVVINLHYIDVHYPKGLYEEIVHSVVMMDEDYQWSEPEDLSINMVRWKRLFSLFPSLQTLTVYATDAYGEEQYPFSIKESISVLRNDIFGKSECTNVVQIKGVRDDGNNSWIHHAFESLKGALDRMNISVSLRNEQDYAGDQNDVLRIERI